MVYARALCILDPNNYGWMGWVGRWVRLDEYLLGFCALTSLRTTLSQIKGYRLDLTFGA